MSPLSDFSLSELLEPSRSVSVDLSFDRAFLLDFFDSSVPDLFDLTLSSPDFSDKVKALESSLLFDSFGATMFHRCTFSLIESSTKGFLESLNCIGEFDALRVTFAGGAIRTYVKLIVSKWNVVMFKDKGIVYSANELFTLVATAPNK